MNRSALQLLFLLLLLVYIVSPWDALPDLLGPLGRFDDVLLAALFFWRYYRPRSGGTSQTRQQQKPRDQNATNRHKTDNPHHILDLPMAASRQEVEARYRDLMKQYHPDRVAHLGEELRELAHEKTIEIQRAYQALIAQRQ